MVAVMGVGAFARRRGLVSLEATQVARRLVAEVCFPALCFQGLAEMDRRELSSGLAVVVLGFVTLALAGCVGLALGRFATRPRASAFAIAIGNWIFFPLPIAKLLFGGEGVHVVLLFNAGAQVFLWTFGLAMLGGSAGATGTGPSRALKNPGLWATAAGLLAAFAWPKAAHVPVLSDTLTLLGAMTVPLAALSIGASLVGAGEATSALHSRPSSAASRDVWIVGLGRLVVAPALTFALALFLVRAFGFELPRATEITVLLIAAMPVSLTAGTLVSQEDAPLAARTILVTTLFSAVTVPAMHALISKAF